MKINRHQKRLSGGGDPSAAGRAEIKFARIAASGSTAAAKVGVQSAGSGGGDDVRLSDDAAAGAAGRHMSSAGSTSLTKLCGMQFQAA